MNHDSARLAIDALFSGKGRKRAELRAHLDGCLECRAHYDRTARAFRALSGRPEEMTPEELWLFEPELPGMVVERPRWTWLFGGIATLAAVSLLIVVNQPPEFASRGNDHPAPAKPGARAFCTRDGAPAPLEADTGQCQEGDHLVLSLTGQGRHAAAVVVVDGDKTESVVSGSAGTLSAEPETVLSVPSSWKPGLKAVVIFSASPIEAADAERCAKGECGASLERADVSLGRP
jgi:hypothetical protein